MSNPQYEIDIKQNRKGLFDFAIRYKGDIIASSKQGYEKLSTMKRIISNMIKSIKNDNLKFNILIKPK